jgi:hypothetical protein
MVVGKGTDKLTNQECPSLKKGEWRGKARPDDWQR